MHFSSFGLLKGKMLIIKTIKEKNDSIYIDMDKNNLVNKEIDEWQ